MDFDKDDPRSQLDKRQLMIVDGRKYLNVGQFMPPSKSKSRDRARQKIKQRHDMKSTVKVTATANERECKHEREQNRSRESTFASASTESRPSSILTYASDNSDINYNFQKRRRRRSRFVSPRDLELPDLEPPSADADADADADIDSDTDSPLSSLSSSPDDWSSPPPRAEDALGRSLVRYHRSDRFQPYPPFARKARRDSASLSLQHQRITRTAIPSTQRSRSQGARVKIEDKSSSSLSSSLSSSWTCTEQSDYSQYSPTLLAQRRQAGKSRTQSQTLNKFQQSSSTVKSKTRWPRPRSSSTLDHQPPSLPNSPVRKRTRPSDHSSTTKRHSIVKTIGTMATENADDVKDSVTMKQEPALLVKLLSDKAKAPTRGSAFAAGYDLYSAAEVTIPANGKAVVSTDIAISVPAGTYGRVAPRSGLAVKHSLHTGAGVIDADYRGELKILIFNLGNKDYEVQCGDRIAQLVLERIYTPEVVVVEQLEESVRGAGGFGSTGRN